jgi:hypothetical protein
MTTHRVIPLDAIAAAPADPAPPSAAAVPLEGIEVRELAADEALAAVRSACEAVTRACAQLAARGCLVLGAHAVPGRPRVVVMSPPERAGLRAGRLRWNRLYATYATKLDEVQVEWCVRRREARIDGLGGAR